MDSTKISMPSGSPNDDHHSSSSTRRKKRRQFILVLVLCFTLILAAIISVIAVLKRQIDSESLAKNPALAIQSVCSISTYYDDDAYCIRILSPLRNASETNPAQIFTRAVRSAIHALTKLTPLPESTDPMTKSTLSSCKALFNETLSQLSIASTTLGVDPGATVMNLTAWLSVEGFKVRNCLEWLEWAAENGITVKKYRKMQRFTMYSKSSLAILSRANMISETFNPTIKSTLASFLAGWNSALAVCVFGAQYLFLVVLFCIILRLY